MKRNILRLSVLLLCCITLASCTDKLAQAAYVTIVGAKAATDKAKAQHSECTATPTANACVIIAKAIGAKDSLIDAVEIYCAGPDFDAGKGCNTPTKGTPAAAQAISKLNAALAVWTQAATDLKGAIQ